MKVPPKSAVDHFRESEFSPLAATAAAAAASFAVGERHADITDLQGLLVHNTLVILVGQNVYFESIIPSGISRTLSIPRKLIIINLLC